MISIDQQVVITLVKSALCSEGYELPEVFDFNNVIQIAKKHQIVNMVYYGGLLCGLQNHPAMQKLVTHVCKQVFITEQQLFEIQRMFNAFQENGIYYAPIKGCLLKKMYPKKDMRAMGDADVLIKFEQYQDIVPVMNELGFEFVKDSSNELVWHKGSSLCLELHRYLVSPSHKDLFSYYENSWDFAVQSPENPYRFELTDENHFIFLFVHFAKHYRSGGIGIRHITDLWVYMSQKPDMDYDYIHSEIKKLKLFDFYTNVIDTLNVWFSQKVHNEKTDIITEFVFNSGNFGTTESALKSRAVKTQKTQKTENVRTKFFFGLIFLPYSNMCVLYPVLKKAPFLLPVMWLVRCFDRLFFKGDTAKKHYKNIKNLTPEIIDEYKKYLLSVGLDFVD